MHYVARWRMHVALTWLKEEDASVSEMASRLGYESEAAFSRAFKRFLGFPPGAVRRAKSDLEAIQQRALTEGLPYQPSTLLEDDLEPHE
jgi:AraC-like DNA-binding protein